MPVTLTLALSGLIALGVGLGILLAPHAFHATSGLTLGDDATLLNEVRAPSGLLVLSGAFILASAFRPATAYPALVLSSALYLSYGGSRVVSILFDGTPNTAMLLVMALEFAVAALCLVALASRQSARRTAAA